MPVPFWLAQKSCIALQPCRAWAAIQTHVILSFPHYSAPITEISSVGFLKNLLGLLLDSLQRENEGAVEVSVPYLPERNYLGSSSRRRGARFVSQSKLDFWEKPKSQRVWEFEYRMYRQIAYSGFLLLSILAVVIPNLSCFACPDPSLRIKCLVLGNLWPDTMDVVMVCVTSQFFVHRYLYGSCATKQADITEECQK